MHRQAISVIRDSVRLQEPIHNAAFRDQQGKKTIFSQALAMQQLIVVNDITVDGIILTKRALIHPTIGKNKIIFRHHPRALKTVIDTEIDLGVDGVYTH